MAGVGDDVYRADPSLSLLAGDRQRIARAPPVSTVLGGSIRQAGVIVRAAVVRIAEVLAGFRDRRVGEREDLLGPDRSGTGT